MDQIFCHSWIPLVVTLAMMGHSIGQICDSSYLSFSIAKMEEICQETINAFPHDVGFVMINAVVAMKHYHGRW